MNVHGTMVTVGRAGVLIRGPARSGKSALALSLLRRAEILRCPARLVADDQVLLSLRAGTVVGRAPASIAGLIEISGIGIVAEPHAGEADLTLLVDLRDAADIPRLPDAQTDSVLGQPIRRVFLPARQAPFGADLLHGLLMRRESPALTKS